MNRVEMGERQLLSTLKRMAGKPATYRRGHSCCDLTVVPIESLPEMIAFDGFNRLQDSQIFLLTISDVRPDGQASNPQRGDVIGFLIGETIECYEVVEDRDGKYFVPFGSNNVGMILHTRKGKNERPA